IIDKDLTIQGLGTDRVVIRKHDVVSERLFQVAASRSVAMSDLTLRDGDQTFGALVQLYGELELTNCHLLNSTTPGFGGVINVEVPSSLIDVPRVNRLSMSGCLVEGNSHTGPGGTWAAIRAVSLPNVEVHLDIADTSFRNNDGSQFNGGYGAVSLTTLTPGGYSFEDIPPATAVLNNVSIVDNLSFIAGAVFVSHRQATVLIEDSEIVNNTANNTAAQVQVGTLTGTDASELTIINSRISN